MPLRARPAATSVHLMKLAVGVSSIEAFEERVATHRASGSGMQVWTRNFPKRAEQVIGEGSLYWVVAGLLSVRMPVLGIAEDTYDDGSRCARIELEPTLIRVTPVRMRPFQGWRYLDPAAAPADLRQVGASGIDALPPQVLRELRDLCLV